MTHSYYILHSAFIIHHSSFSILALSLLSPGFALAGVLLAALPIIIHLLNRRRYKVVHWAAMDFLLRAMKRNRRRLKFESWLLLATRCCVLGLMGFALSRPLGCSDSAIARAGRRSGLHVFVIDNSYSMSYPGRSGQTHFDAAKKWALQEIDSLDSGGESVAIITAGQPAKAVLPEPTFDLQQAHEVVERLTPTFGATDLAGALRLAVELGRQKNRQPNKTVYLLTDSTRSAWMGSHAAELKSLGRDLAANYHVVLDDFSTGRQWNSAVLDVSPQSGVLTTRAGFTSDFTATARSFGRSINVPLQWSVDGKLVPGSSSARLNAQTPPQVQSQIEFTTGGPHVVTAAVAGQDPLKFDDSRSRIVNVLTDLKTLIVEGQHSAGPLGGSAAFLQLALDPPSSATPNTSGSHGDGFVLPEVISDLELGNRVLGDYRTVVLCNVAQMPATTANQLQAFVKNGGSLILFMGDAVDSENYNRQLLSRGLLPGPLIKRVSAPANSDGFGFDFNPDGPLHPLLRAFAHQPKTGLDTARVFTYWQADVPNDPQLRVLNYRSVAGKKPDAAITEQSLGHGRVIFFSTTAGPDWTTLPAKPAYVALMNELLAGSVNPEDGWMNLTIGQPLVVPATVKVSNVPTLIDPQSRVLPLQSTATTNGVEFHSAALNQPGIYHLNTGVATLPIAVNVPADEADVSTIDRSAIKAALGGIDFITPGAGSAAMASASDSADFGWDIMVLVLVAAAFEAFLAMKFGHGRRV